MAFSLPGRSPVVIEVFYINGRRVREIANEDLSDDAHLVRWIGQNHQGEEVPSGVYFFRLEQTLETVRRSFVYTQ
jgi:hypothetical protein